MISANGFQATFKYITMFQEGLICTLALSAFTVILGFILALVLALMRMSDFRPFRAHYCYQNKKEQKYDRIGYHQATERM